MGWIIGIGCILGVIAFVCLVVLWLNRDMWEDFGGIGDFFGEDEKEEETSRIEEGRMA